MRWLAAILLGIVALAEEPVLVHLRPSVQVAAPVARLADIAQCSGPADVIAMLAELPVQALGATPVLVDERAVRSAVGRRAPITVSGTCSVRQPLRTISEEALATAARNALEIPGILSEMSVLRSSGPLSLGDDGSEPELRAEAMDRQRSGDVPVRVRVFRHGEEVARALVSLRIRRQTTGVMLTTAIRRGMVIGAEAVAPTRVELNGGTQEVCPSVDAVIGRQAVRDLQPGQVVTPMMIEPALDVRPGQAVTMVWRSNGIELSAPGESLAAGRCGELIHVRRGGDERRIRAQIIAPGMVLVNW